MFENIYENLFKELNNGKQSALLTLMKPTSLKKGVIEKKVCVTKADLESDSSPIMEDLKNEIFNTFKTGIPFLYKSENESVLIEPFFPKPRLIILGGGHIAKPLCEFAFKVGFSVVVADDRPSFANTNRFPEADEVICEDFQNVFDKLNL